ncbi:M81 family metallopeptidase, partial [Bradyrhizobium sp.]
LVAAAVPNGLVTRAAFETLRDQILADLRAALPIDMALIGLHGAMIADGYDDCEGELLSRIREIAGPDVVIGATLDPHVHMSELMVKSADLLICWKEYPHTDILERAQDLVKLCTELAEKRLKLRSALVDTDMIVTLHTTREPVRSFVDRITALEGKDGIVSVSIVHGFGWGDTPAMGTKVLVYSDAAVDPDGARAQALARKLADELIGMREAVTERMPGVDAALDQALAKDGTIVLGDASDNPGGGAPGDSTFILRRVLERKIENVCVGPMWDPIAVRIAFDAGIGAKLPLRIGGKIGPLSGDPVDATWEIKALKENMVMTGLAGTPAKLGDCALIATAGVEVVITTFRCQAFGRDFLTQLGCDPATRKLVVVKSAQHFRAAFAPIAADIIMVDAPGVVARDVTTLPYRKIKRPKWPLDELLQPTRA